MPDYRVKISDKSDHHTYQNLSSNPTDKKSKIDNNYHLFSLVFKFDFAKLIFIVSRPEFI